jgi:hypothetical protein
MVSADGPACEPVSRPLLAWSATNNTRWEAQLSSDDGCRGNPEAVVLAAESKNLEAPAVSVTFVTPH